MHPLLSPPLVEHVVLLLPLVEHAAGVPAHVAGFHLQVLFSQLVWFAFDVHGNTVPVH